MLVLAHLHRPVLTQQVHSLGHLAFQGRPSFAKLYLNFRQTFANTHAIVLQKETYIINNKYKSLQCKFRHVHMNFCQNFSQKKKIAISEKTLAETVRKPLSWTFCSTLIYSMYIYIIFTNPRQRLAPQRLRPIDASEGKAWHRKNGAHIWLYLAAAVWVYVNMLEWVYWNSKRFLHFDSFCLSTWSNFITANRLDSA